VGVTLFDHETDEIVFDINFWHWRAIVEVVRDLQILPDDRAELLHEPFVGELTEPEARIVAAAIRERVLPTMADEERVLLDGTRTTTPDDGTFHREPVEQHRNYSTTRAVLEKFADACASCHGFRIS
jgi:hypothetical protein